MDPKKLNKKRKLDIHSKKGKVKKLKLQPQEEIAKNEENSESTLINTKEVPIKPKVKLSPEEIAKEYPILNDGELVKKFLAVPMNNNQKGRIRQMVRDSLKGSTDNTSPDVIQTKIQSIIKSSKELTEPELRKVRILFNMLKTSLSNGVEEKVKKQKKKAKKDNKIKKTKEVDNKDIKEENNEDTKEAKNEDTEEKQNKEVPEKKDKVKGPKRYVVFVGNLPIDIDKEKILQHFSDLEDHIVDVRLPAREEGRKSTIAYVEVKDENTYELALSKHHSMLDNKRINVLYSTQKNSKISKSEAKSTSAKLVALQKSGKLVGSIPLNRKRSHRRNKAKRAAKAKEESS